MPCWHLVVLHTDGLMLVRCNPIPLDRAVWLRLEMPARIKTLIKDLRVDQSLI